MTSEGICALLASEGNWLVGSGGENWLIVIDTLQCSIVRFIFREVHNF